jgi:hypothetical protein
MRSTPRTRRWAALGATAALASAAFAVPALAQGADEATGAVRSDRVGSAEPGERHAEVLAELEELEGDALVEKLEELFAEREALRAERFAEQQTARTERFAEREALRAERFTERQTARTERFAEVLAELEGLVGEELGEKLEELRAEHTAARVERRGERQALRAERRGIGAERQAECAALRAERQAFRAERRTGGPGDGFGHGMGADGE